MNNTLTNCFTSIFDELDLKKSELEHEKLINLHQGKTTFAPSISLTYQQQEFPLLPHMHASPGGISATLDKIIHTKHATDSFHDKKIVLSNGATHGIRLALDVLLHPGDEVIILSPHWLFIKGIVTAARGVAIEVPIFDKLSKNPKYDFISSIQQYSTNKTKAIYFNSPNNPTGYSFSTQQLASIAEFAVRNQWWVLSDNAYEYYDFSSQGFKNIANTSSINDTLISIYSFSKSYVMPGYRIGYLIIPNYLAKRFYKASLYNNYSISTISQYAAYSVLDTDPKVIKTRSSHVNKLRQLVLTNLEVPHTSAIGGFYTFLDLSAISNHLSVEQFISICIKNGFTLAAGKYFGNHFHHCARLCYTSTDESTLLSCIDRLNSLYQSYIS